MKTRGLGRIYQPTYRDRATREVRTSPTFWIQYSHRGVKHRESSNSTRHADAVRLLKRRIEQMGRGQLIGPNPEKVTFEDLAIMVLDDYRVNGRKSLKRALSGVKHLQDYFGLARALDVTGDRINAYIRNRQESGAQNATIQYELALLKRAFTLAVRAGRLTHRPYIPSLEVRNVRTGFFEDSEFLAVRSHLPDHLKPIVEFAHLTGWRVRSEVLPLTWRQVDFDRGIVRLEPGSTKNDEGRVFPFSALPALADLLRCQWDRTMELQMQRGSVVPWVFHRNGQRVRDFRRAWENACTLAGVPGRILHDFRRTAVRNLERAGVSRSVAMKLVGHKTEAIYRRYAIVCEADLSEGVKKLATLAAGNVGGQMAKVVPLTGRTGKAEAKQEVIPG